jgi:hypothetical protein
MSNRTEYMIYTIIAFVFSFIAVGIFTYLYHEICFNNPHCYWYQALIPAIIFAIVLPFLKFKYNPVRHK